MQAREKLYSADTLWELAHLPENDLKIFELVQGALIEMPPPGFAHGEIVAEFSLHLRLFVKAQGLGSVTTESGYILHCDPDSGDTVRAPDVAFIAAARIPQPKPDKYMPVPPDLAVEVVSPPDSADDVMDKVREYLLYGVKAVVIIYPKSKEVDVRSQNEVRHFTEDDTLTLDEVLPGFSLPVRDIFPK